MMAVRLGMRAGCVSWPDPDDFPDAAITGTGGQRNRAAGGSAARSPELRVSHASAGQVTVCTVVVTSEPTEPVSASRQSTGVADFEMSLHRSPAMPIRMTG